MSKQVQAISSLLVIAICTTTLLQPTTAQLPFPPLPPFPPFPFPPIGGGGRFPFPLPPLPPFAFPPIGPLPPLPPFPFPPIGPLPPLPPFPFPPIGGSSSFKLPFPLPSRKVQQESDAPKCWSSLAKIEGCVQSIQGSIVGGKASNLGPACCQAIQEIAADCMAQMFPTIPAFPPLLKEICAKSNLEMEHRSRPKVV